MTDRDLTLAKLLHGIVHPQHSWETSDGWQRERARGYARFVNEGLAAADLVIRPLVATDEMAAAGLLAVYSSGAPDFEGDTSSDCASISPLLNADEAKQVYAAMVGEEGGG